MVEKVQLELDVQPVREPPQTRPRSEASAFLETYGLGLLFLLTVAIGMFLAISVLRMAIQDSRMVGIEDSRSARCLVIQERVRKGTLPMDEDDIPGGAAEGPLRREDALALIRAGKLQSLPLCPEQGPLRTRDAYHFVLALDGDGAVELRCRQHGALRREE